MVITCWVEVGSRGKDGSTVHTRAWAGAGCTLMTTSLPTPSSPLPSSPLPLGALQGQLQLHELPPVSLEAPGLGLASISTLDLWHPGFLCPSCRKDSLPTGPQCSCSPMPHPSVLRAQVMTPSHHFHCCLSLCCPSGRRDN